MQGWAPSSRNVWEILGAETYNPLRFILWLQFLFSDHYHGMAVKADSGAGFLNEIWGNDGIAHKHVWLFSLEHRVNTVHLQVAPFPL